MNNQGNFYLNQPNGMAKSQQVSGPQNPGRRDYFANVASNMIIRPPSNTQPQIKRPQASLPNYLGSSPSSVSVPNPNSQFQARPPPPSLYYSYPSMQFYPPNFHANPSSFPPIGFPYQMAPMPMPYPFYSQPGMPNQKAPEPKSISKKEEIDDEESDEEPLDPKMMLMMKMLGIDGEKSEDKEMEKLEHEKAYFDKISKTLEAQNKIIEDLYGSINNLKREEKDYERKRMKKKAKKLQKMIEEQKMINQHQDFYNDLKTNMDNYVNELMKIVRVNQENKGRGEEMDEMTAYMGGGNGGQGNFAPNPMNPLGLPLNMMMQPF